MLEVSLDAVSQALIGGIIFRTDQKPVTWIFLSAGFGIPAGGTRCWRGRRLGLGSKWSDREACHKARISTVCLLKLYLLY
jgi:hypothetical protein